MVLHYSDDLLKTPDPNGGKFGDWIVKKDTFNVTCRLCKSNVCNKEGEKALAKHSSSAKHHKAKGAQAGTGIFFVFEFTFYMQCVAVCCWYKILIYLHGDFFCAEPDLYIHLSSECIWHFDGGRRLTMTALCYRSMWYNLTLVLSYWNTISICIYTSHVVCTSAGINDITITIVCICFNLVLYAVTGAYLYISLLSSGGCFGAWIDHLDSFKNPNPRHSKVGFLKVVCYKHCNYTSMVDIY